jgi:hypothetical protein
MPTDLMPPDTPDWAMLSRQFVEVRLGSEIYRRGHVDDMMPDGSGLWMAADGILGRDLIWREQGFTVGKLFRPADGVSNLSWAPNRATHPQARKNLASQGTGRDW